MRLHERRREIDEVLDVVPVQLTTRDSRFGKWR
jgi:hypothetical protein